MNLPDIAISVRQPWAWALIFAGKDMENRSHGAIRMMTRMAPLIGRKAIHASKGMTRDEYESARDFMASIGIQVPHPGHLARGGIIGSVEIVGTVKASDKPQSDWFFGPGALVCANPEHCRFIPSVGALGLFKWTEADLSIVPTPARWMLPVEAPSPARNADLPMGF
ncbi:MAG: hypothetical protein GC182_08785 [Rhodopseudomonas sp.]|nr:hypothetical protein [Rhodopseudomonas sp.]